MTIAYFDCFAGISGDMVLGALIDLGLDADRLRQELALLPLGGYELRAEKVLKRGIAATRVQVLTAEEREHRRLQDIKAIIDGSALPPTVKERSVEIFTRLAVAEAKIHQTSIEQVHFHEVGAVDAIIDIVGSVIGLQALGVEKVAASPLATGSGLVKCAHGWFPVPAPATLELLRGCPIYAGDIEKEMTTPTGAAIISTICREFGPMPVMTVKATGYGAGGYELERPNVLRVILGEEAGLEGIFTAGQEAIRVPGEAVPEGTEVRGKRFGGAGEIQVDEVFMIEVNIDDMNPEFYEHLFAVLLKAGAMDVFLQAIQMKKNRPAQMLSVMAASEKVRPLTECLFAETTTIGLRIYPVKKMMLPYEVIQVRTEWGEARLKVARRGNQVTNIAPEYEDCRRIALEQQLPLKQVYDAVKAAATAKAGKENADGGKAGEVCWE
ncbi:MAG: nickel pincer cofactor biosynthesis protein LarC [Peptococcaceae bacterium]|jgi:uncharacterized protein (TIGR00299 family) protein|nr:nickel pincer cofactor biosynthesis protein LarC [Peptococcaceae bacterium]